MSLPVLQQGPKIKPSKAAPRRAAVLILVHVLIALHIAHWLTTGESITPVEPSEAMEFGRGDVINAGLIFFVAMIGLTAVFGRFFCGWGCHVVALQDLSRHLLEKVGIRPAPLRSRALLWVPPIAFVYMFLWPAIYRVWIGDKFGPAHTEWTTTEFWATFPGFWIGALTFFLCGFVIIYALGAKGFCTYACPYGAIFGAVDRLAPMRIRVTDACAGCGHCTAVCTSNVRVHEEVRDWGMVVSPGCMKCLDCVSVCPNDALYYGSGPIPWFASPRTETPTERRKKLALWEEALLLTAFAAAFFTFRGLYGTLPFLMSLGLAAILAAVVHTTALLFVRKNVARRRFRLKFGGRIQTAGYVFLAFVLATSIFWGHSAWIRVNAALGLHELEQLGTLHQAALDVTQSSLNLDAAQRVQVDKATRHLSIVRDDGLLPTRGNASRLALLALIRGDMEELQQNAQLAVDRGEDRASIYQLLAIDALRRGKPEAAANAYDHALAVDSLRPELVLGLGVAYANAGRLDQAAAALERGLSEIGRTVDLLYNFALVRAYQGRSREAIALFREVLEMRPDHDAARENLAALEEITP